MLASIYKGLMGCATPLLETYLRRRLRQGKEDAARFAERHGEAAKPRPQGKLVWLHGASVGEALSLLALVGAVRAAYPGWHILVTTGTVTSAKLMAARLPGGAIHQYVPVDHPLWTEKFVDHWRPDLAVWSESELWPNLLAAVHKRNIPAVLLNARMSEKSFRRWQCAPSLIRGTLQTFTLCLGQNEAEVARLRALGANDARVSGNLKYAAAPLPDDAAKRAALESAIGARPRLLWASTHPGEEEIALRLHKTLRAAQPDLLTIIAPRHPQRGAEIKALAQAAQLRAALRSQNDSPDKDIYIADTLGEMGLFFRLAPDVVMGGSFVPHGGHNPIEPGQLGCKIFYGPHMFNFLTICAEFESHGAARALKDEAELAAALGDSLAHPATTAPLARAAQGWTQSQARVVDDIMGALAPYLKEGAAA